ncbi:phosphocholine-specific phospholipase C [Sphingobacterium lactis]|uniref:phosphocholine-specific phospholipase C n=1 Tax=Sphingobacterium lactis TaxID=797291 RepID=UPI003DA41689
MDSRRDFLKKASMLAGATAAIHVMPASIQRALAIEAKAGSTYLDAEHIVFLMQENRSFDHCFGTLKGVRGFNDPRVMRQPNGLPVWYQSNGNKQIHPPFHLDIVNTKATWMGDLPHSWHNMLAARNEGKMNNWLEAKKPGNEAYKHIPLTMGYYERKDIPFYYAFADAFTVCDQHFCSSLTGTSANRSYFWSGTVREEAHNPESTAHVDNYQINYKDVSWKTYPERLEEAGVSWKVYQNELSLPVGFEGEEESWLANFTDNNLEFHKQYQVKFHPAYHAYAKRRVKEIEHLLTVAKFANQEAYEKVVKELEGYRSDVAAYSPENFAKLSKQQQAIHNKAFTTNVHDPAYHALSSISYTENGEKKTVQVPQGDVFHQFREDVKKGQLPTVSWLVAPSRFSDHPGSPWYGAWYVSETLDILTANPEVWKKTIFILTYDENDGYFDHVSPFVPALSSAPHSGALPKGLDTEAEYVTQDQERKRINKEIDFPNSPIGLGYRVPMVVASPWTKGGWVNSEVFDLTSNLQFLEHFLQKKYKKKVKEENITPWRRLVCGDLTSVFRPVPDSQRPNIDFVDRDQYVERIYTAKNKALPAGYETLDDRTLTLWKEDLLRPTGLNLQEPGTKLACAIPYNMDANLVIDQEKGIVQMQFEVEGVFRKSTKDHAAPFQVMSLVSYGAWEPGKVWSFTAKENEILTYNWKIADFPDGKFSFTVHGPNGFYRLFKGSLQSKPYPIKVKVADFRKGFQVMINTAGEKLVVADVSYGLASQNVPQGSGKLQWNLESSDGWYDFAIQHPDDPEFLFRFAGHQEDGKPSTTDPLMGKNS